MSESPGVYTDTTTSRKTAKEVPVVQDTGIFQYPTGDMYDGYFEAKKKDKTVKMHGPGIYKTAAGDTYSGTWDTDKLGANDEVTITFTDGSKYEGTFKDWAYNGVGKYSYPNGSILTCNFSGNCPVGELSLTDPNGHDWQAKADVGFAWFRPVNHYYALLEKTIDTGKKRRPRSPERFKTQP